MNYDEAMQYLDATMKFGSRLGLERMDALMRLLGQPGQHIPCIHVAGTNGKGSVTAMTAAILAASGRRVGVYTSPYLRRFSERIRVIGGAAGLERLAADETEGEIPRDDTAEIITEVRSAVERITGEGGDHPTEFEIVTAAAFLHFERAGCDFLVLETGLGGRLDSTNVVRSPLRCVITAIGYDHMDRLGGTIEAISAEKAGIFKEGCEAVMLDPADYTDPDSARRILGVFRAKADERGVPLRLTGKADLIPGSYSLEGQTFSVLLPDEGDGRREAIPLSTTLLGTFQPLNCALAVAACRGLAGSGAMIRGIALGRWPGRMEVLRREGPTVILDGAHNPQGAEAFRQSLEQLLEGRKIFFLCGVMADKDYRTVLATVFSSKRYRIAGVCCTRPPNPRALPAEELADTASEILDNFPFSSYNGLVEIFSRDDAAEATREALSAAVSAGAVLAAFGSLYMAGIVRDTVLQHEGVPRPGV